MHLLLQPAHEALQPGLEQPVQAHGALPVLGELAAAAMGAAGGGGHERQLGQVVHCLDRIPGRLVAQARLLCGGRDRAALADRLEQRDAPVHEKALPAAIEAQVAGERQGLERAGTVGSQAGLHIAMHSSI
jgi:hypothetical protein